MTFAELFGRTPDGSWQAPGRVNLIGEHTDYNDGLVLPIALPQRVLVTAAARDDGVLRMASTQEDGGIVEAVLDDLRPGSIAGWSAYPQGAAWVLREAGQPIGGADLLVDSDLPAGAGLSSSAALLCATSVALLDLAGVKVAPDEVARLAQRAENEYVGAPVGLMDQMASMCCTAGHALFFDVRAMFVEQVPFDPDAVGLRLLVVDVKAPHRHVGGEYADRRKSCEAAARALGVPALRSASAHAVAGLSDDLVRRRARHVVTEIARVSETVALLRAGRLSEVGPLFTASHASMRDDFEITVPEIDLAVDTALAAGALGARMTGGGFGGCVIALVPASSAGTVLTAVEKAFADCGYATPAAVEATPSDSAGRLT